MQYLGIVHIWLSNVCDIILYFKILSITFKRGKGQSSLAMIYILRKNVLETYNEFWVPPYIPVHQEGQNQIIDSYTEV